MCVCVCVCVYVCMFSFAMFISFDVHNKKALRVDQEGCMQQRLECFGGGGESDHRSADGEGDGGTKK